MVHRVFIQNCVMHSYNENDEVVQTIEVGPILTTLCKSSQIVVGVRKENTESMTLVPLDDIKSKYFISLDTYCNKTKLNQIAQDYFLRHNLIYDPSQNVLRDIKEPERHDNNQYSSERCEAAVKLWTVTPGIHPEVPTDTTDMFSRSARKKRQMYEPPPITNPKRSRAVVDLSTICEEEGTAAHKTTKDSKPKQVSTTKPKTTRRYTKKTVTATKTTTPAIATPTTIALPPPLISSTGTNHTEGDDIKKRKELQDMEIEVESKRTAMQEEVKHNEFERSMALLGQFSKHSSMLLKRSGRKNSETSCCGPRVVSHSLSSLAWPATVSESGSSSVDVEVVKKKTLTINEKVVFMFNQMGIALSPKQEPLFDQCQRILDSVGDPTLAEECSTLPTFAKVNHLYESMKNMELL